MKPINDHVDDLLLQLPLRILDGDGPEIRIRIKRVLDAVARDQRHACAEAVLAIEGNAWSKDRAHQVVMNTNI